MRRLGKKGAANLKNIAALKIKFNSLGICFCELCGKASNELTFAHRTTRQHIRSQDDMEAVARLCLVCHIAIEGKPYMTEYIDRIIDNRIDRSFEAA